MFESSIILASIMEKERYVALSTVSQKKDKIMNHHLQVFIAAAGAGRDLFRGFLCGFAAARR